MTGYSYSTKDCISSSEIWQKHPALRWRNCGSNGMFIGKVVFLTIFVNDADSHWSKMAMKKFKNVVNAAGLFFMRNGGQERGLDIPCQVSILSPRNIPSINRDNFSNYKDRIVYPLFSSDLRSLRLDVKRQTGADEVVVIFAFNKKGKSFAQCKGAELPSSNRTFSSAEEAVCIFAKADHVFYTLLHEVTHLFGGIDYYEAPFKDVALSLFPESIMLCKEPEKPSIDSLTRYLIGWDLRPDEKALAFLRRTI